MGSGCTCIAALAVVGKRVARAQCCIPDVVQELFRRDVPELGDEIEGCEQHQEKELATFIFFLREGERKKERKKEPFSKRTTKQERRTRGKKEKESKQEQG